MLQGQPERGRIQHGDGLVTPGKLRAHRARRRAVRGAPSDVDGGDAHGYSGLPAHTERPGYATMRSPFSHFRRAP
ncbi:hypothetical protein UK15_24245 [Streptomyces variegatus]|uniref:Uncharacterized protein n=1 Tax=Streptomyces variegatus TaxID=284040 RepID=A0A0M2GND5_9ACTN|nr:hypothetical protein UK15_24245 [Streptomyces variegatus]